MILPLCSLFSTLDIHALLCFFRIPITCIHLTTPSPTYSSVWQIILYTVLQLGLNCRRERRGLSWYNTRIVKKNYNHGQSCWNILQYLAKWAQKLACTQDCEGRVNRETFRSVYSCTVPRNFVTDSRIFIYSRYLIGVFCYAKKELFSVSTWLDPVFHTPRAKLSRWRLSPSFGIITCKCNSRYLAYITASCLILINWNIFLECPFVHLREWNLTNHFDKLVFSWPPVIVSDFVFRFKLVTFCVQCLDTLLSLLVWKKIITWHWEKFLPIQTLRGASNQFVKPEGGWSG